jgi:hypothetical protein
VPFDFSFPCEIPRSTRQSIWFRVLGFGFPLLDFGSCRRLFFWAPIFLFPTSKRTAVSIPHRVSFHRRLRSPLCLAPKALRFFDSRSEFCRRRRLCSDFEILLAVSVAGFSFLSASSAGAGVVDSFTPCLLLLLFHPPPVLFFLRSGRFLLSSSGYSSTDFVAWFWCQSGLD